MRAAPTVLVTTRLQAGWWLAAWAAWLASLCLLLAWMAWQGAAGLALWQGPPLLVICTAALGLAHLALRLRCARQTPLSLRFSGQQWHCAPWSASGTVPEPEITGTLELMLDLGDALLLRWRPHASARPTPRSRWLALTRDSVGESLWHGLRVALQWPVAAPDGAQEVAP